MTGQHKNLYLGLDIGSTTIKGVVLDESGTQIFSSYQRHNSHIRPSLKALLERLRDSFPQIPFSIALTGSGAIDLSASLDLPFIQEVLACNLAISRAIPDADVIVELGGEDAKLTYLTGGLEQRMNETCAGGTGSFIDQMAAFIGTDAESLDELALQHRSIYPIASRCGVFAKSDILPLLNEGCDKRDLSASIMQAVVGQTISGLAQGRTIKGKAVFLGGPLRFLKSLQQRFLANLEQVHEAVFPENGHYFVAIGAALHALYSRPAIKYLPAILHKLSLSAIALEKPRLRPLFHSLEDWQKFRKRHDGKEPELADLRNAKGSAWLGIDSGSTTLKAVLLNETGVIIHQWYGSNSGNPLLGAVQILKDIYSRKSPDLIIRGSCATGYGSALLCAALGIDEDEVETVSHFEAAATIDPEVSFILDIGGQDIKCMHIRNGSIYRISLNEACSAGCGSFIENFAGSLGLDICTFAKKACLAKQPVDLGTRCTVFMNSRVKQAQKEGATLEDIAAGLSWSVIRNAIFKVMKIGSTAELGEHIVVQGGAFLNDALLRALELELGRQVRRPAIAGLMGAFGSALIARKRHPYGRSKIISNDALAAFGADTKNSRCKKCSNSCLLTITKFSDGRHFISGNRCEKGANTASTELPNIVSWKCRRLFSYEPLTLEKAKRGSIGIPRTLNLYENFPLWFTIFTRLGYRVELSSPSSRELYYSAFDTIPSQTVCYPAKLAHGHILDLIERGISVIFYPCVKREQQDADFLHGTHNCPVVTGYPELLSLNIPEVHRAINFIHPFLPLDRNALPRRLAEIPLFGDISFMELQEAVQAGFDELAHYRDELRQAGEQALATLKEQNKFGVVLAGHPYHIDPEINHGIPEIINSCGMGVLTEDSVAHLIGNPGSLRVVDQWAYHSRLYRAGAFVGTMPNLAIMQLVSFGCGIDAITADQLEEITERNGRLYAQIKVDEGINMGAARIRIRSLLAAMKARQADEHLHNCHSAGKGLQMEEQWPVFLPEMKNTHTLLIPQMSPLHFQFAKEIFASEGYDAILLEHVDRKAIELGLRHVNNDACYPAIIVIGQLMQAIGSGRYDPDKTALVISQTGGGCRATNYIGFLRKALKNAGLGNIPIANFSATGHGPGIRLTTRMLSRMIMAGHYGDALMRTLHRTRPYERERGATHELVQKWSRIAAGNIESGNLFAFQRNMFAMIDEFDKLPIKTEERRPRVGLVGEILIKYHPDANNNAAAIIEEEGGEAVVTDIMDFMLYGMYEHIFNFEHLTGTRKGWLLARLGIAWQELTRLSLRLALNRSSRFGKSTGFKDMRAYAKKLISLGHQTGEGWLLAAEMVKMLESGINAILCMQPFGCLPNHIVGKGLIRELKRRYPGALIMPLDYDPGASETNQINRIKLMMQAALKSHSQIRL